MKESYKERQPLQNQFHKDVEEIISTEIILRVCIFHILKNKYGIPMTFKPETILKENIEQRKIENVLTVINDEQINAAGFSSRNEFATAFSSDLDKVLNQNKEIEELILKLYNELIPLYTSRGSSQIFDKTKNQRKKILKRAKRDKFSFHKDQKLVWGEALDKLELLIDFIRESFDYYYPVIQEKIRKEEDLVLFVLSRLMAKACRISQEILELLRNGWPDEAFARWRALHETVVILIFLSDNNTETSERYVDHEVVQVYKLESTQRRIFLSNDEEVNDDFRLLENDYKKIIEKYEKGFSSDYGWANKALGLKRATFSDIEKSIKFNHFRHLYRESSSFVHSNANSLFYSLGVPDSWGDFISGPSCMGAGRPGHSTAQSLCQIFTIFILYDSPILDRIVSADIVWKLKEETITSFQKCHDRIIWKDEEE